MTQEAEQLESIALADAVTNMAIDTGNFNEAITALPFPYRPTLLGEDRLEWAMHAFREEIKEFEDATKAGDIVEAADGLVDLVYFALGRLHEMGVPASAVWEAVHQKNMEKRRGELSKRPGSRGHDAIKPAGWTPPDHSWLLDYSVADVEKVKAYDAMSPVLKRVAALRAKKGNDYNTGIQLNDYFPFGHKSYLQMLHVKQLRLVSLDVLREAGKSANFESTIDSVDDLINYASFYGEWLEAETAAAEALAHAQED